MKSDAIDIFVCPACVSTLTLRADRTEDGEIIEGALQCPQCETVYPIVGGVPRFVRTGAYASSFGRQWNWFRTVQIDSLTGRSESQKALEGATGWTAEDIRGRLVLDAGGGAGRFAECIAAQGGRVVAVDLTTAIDAAYANIGRRPGVYLAQADIFALPVRPATFDLAYSIGVLHHTPDPERAFAHVAQTVKPGGQFAVYLYARYGASHRGSDAIRRVTTRLPAPLMLACCTAAIPLYFLYRIPVLGRVFMAAAPISLEPHWRWRWLDTFDWYTPKYQFKYLYPEVFRWFTNNGFRDVAIFDGPIRMRGEKDPAEAPHGTHQPGELVAAAV